MLPRFVINAASFVVLSVVAFSRCEDRDCHGLLRPNVVFFGETLDSHLLTMVEKEIETCDLCLVVSYHRDV